MERHPITWTAPQPLWAEASGGTEGRAAMSAPAILRFTTDDFMPEFLNVLATDPHRLGEYRVVKETWRGVLDQPLPLTPKKMFALPLQRLAAAKQRRNGKALGDEGGKLKPHDDAKAVPLKLYQPAHQRFYLVTSCLVCQLAGLPDRKVDPGKHEQAGFVMRRLLPPKLAKPNPDALWIEHAWIEKNGARYWQPVPDEKQRELFETTEGQREEVLPLFSVNHTQDDRHQRRMMAGLIPVGKREAYLAASGGPENPSGGVTSITARKALLRKEVIEPWKAIIAQAADAEKKISEPVNGNKVADDSNAALKARRQSRAQIQTASWFILLDMANFLERYVNPVWKKLNGQTPSTPLNSSQDSLVAELNKTCVDPSLVPSGSTFGDVPVGGLFPSGLLRSLPDALIAIRTGTRAVDMDAADTNLEATYQRGESRGLWPDFLFPLADPQFPALAALPQDISLTPLSDPVAAKEETEELDFAEKNEAERPLATAPASVTECLARLARLDKLAALIIRALDNSEKKPEPAVPLAARQPADALEGWFVIRCVYARPACGPLHQDVVSQATEAFQLAGFFDPDAPARPIRIGLPIDTTPAGLRKFDRNTAFVISDTLCGQIARLKGITLGDLVRTVLPWPLHKDLDVPDKGPCKKGDASLGMICSLSIPIITICALILLMIMVSILDYVFRWMPYFIMCFPVPGLSAKKPPASPPPAP